MARLEIPESLQNIYKSFHERVMNAAQGIDEPMQWPFTSGQVGPGPAEFVGGMIAPATVQEAIVGGLMGLAPGYIAANYRSPEAIAQLRRAMAEENRARGAVSEISRERSFYPPVTREPDGTVVTYPPIKGLYEGVDPVDQILRGSWFHGMRPEARRQVVSEWEKMVTPRDSTWNWIKNYDVPPLDIVAQHNNAETAYKGIPLELLGALERGLPASTHATPSYTRFGEPYGVSITASPSIARNFSADEYIHRVQPIYGGPPTEKIIPMWRPEGVKAMNEGYNEAFNQWLNQTDLPVRKTISEYISHQMGPQGNASNYGSVNNILTDWANLALKHQTSASEFNTLYSKALQDKGYRGILYSPQRYNEYEMLMLDPSFVRPLDYRKAGEYGENPRYGGASALMGFVTPPGKESMRVTPGAAKGYTAAQPEFQTGTTRLSDVFNQVPWVDRINMENKRRIAELIDAQYREQVLNQLFGGR